MNKRLRRNVLKGLVASVPAMWTKPIVDNVVLPAHAITSGAGCIEIEEGLFADFQGGNAIPIFSQLYSDSECTEENGLIGNPLVYAPQGAAQAVFLCQTNFGISEVREEDNDVWNCLNP